MAELFAVSDWLSATRGTLLGNRSALEAVTDFFIDSRKVVANQCFVPLKGENTDGHNFVPAALERGCQAVLVGRDYHHAAQGWAATWQSAGFVLVENTLQALADLAAWHVDSLPGLVRVGITGSNGKTTTKELTAAVVSTLGPTFYTEGNFNSEIGLPLMCLKLRSSHKYAVLELGINHVGEMALMAKVARPFVSVITNIGTAHIGIIGSQQQIALEKKQIFSFSPADSHAVLPADDEFLPVLKENCPGQISLFSLTMPGFALLEDRGWAGTVFTWHGQRVELGLPGKHNLLNALAALQVGQILGADPVKAAQAISQVKPLFGRSELLPGPVTVLQDCYNANYDSMISLLDMAEQMQWAGRKVYVLGSMRELGRQGPALHARLGERAAGLKADAVFFFGAEAEQAYEAFKQKKFGGFGFWTAHFPDLEAAVNDFVRDGDLVILKGSRGVALERLTEGLRRPHVL